MVYSLLMVNVSNPGYYCTVDLWNYCGDNGEYWKQLVDIKVPLSIDDMACLTYTSLVMLLSVLSLIAVCNKKKTMNNNVLLSLLFASGMVLLLFSVYTIAIQLYAPNRSAPGSSDISSKIRSHLKDSLHAYSNGEDGNFNNYAWEMTMKDGCCCGVDGYTDFLDVGAEIPEYCICTSNMTSNSSTLHCYDPQYECEIETEYNVTTKGCYEFITSHVQSHQNDIYFRKFLMSMCVSAIQSICFFFLIIIFYNIVLLQRNNQTKWERAASVPL